MGQYMVSYFKDNSLMIKQNKSYDYSCYFTYSDPKGKLLKIIEIICKVFKNKMNGPWDLWWCVCMCVYE